MELATAVRFMDKIEYTPTCWRWTGKIDRGYGRFLIDGKSKRAYRIAYELMIRRVPEGMELDHICRNKACVNPAHLEPVIHRENVLRGEGTAAVNARKTHCPRGHELSEGNLVGSLWRLRNRRSCLICAKAWAGERRRRKKEALWRS